MYAETYSFNLVSIGDSSDKADIDIEFVVQGGWVGGTWYVVSNPTLIMLGSVGDKLGILTIIFLKHSFLFTISSNI